MISTSGPDGISPKARVQGRRRGSGSALRRDAEPLVRRGAAGASSDREVFHVFLTIRPPGPVPWTRPQIDAFFVGDTARDGAGLDPARILPSPQPRSPVRQSAAGRYRDVRRFGGWPGWSLRRFGGSFRLWCAAWAAARSGFCDRRREPLRLPRRHTAIGAPTATTSPGLARNCNIDAARLRFDFNRRLVGFDLGDHIALVDRLADLFLSS